MCFIISLIPATFWVVIGYFVLCMSARADEPLMKFGRLLAIWVFVLAALIPIMGLAITIGGLCPISELMALHQ